MNVARFLLKNSRERSEGCGNLVRETHTETLEKVSSKKIPLIMKVELPDLHKTPRGKQTFPFSL